MISHCDFDLILNVEEHFFHVTVRHLFFFLKGISIHLLSSLFSGDFRFFWNNNCEYLIHHIYKPFISCVECNIFSYSAFLVLSVFLSYSQKIFNLMQPYLFRFYSLGLLSNDCYYSKEEFTYYYCFL